MLFPAYTSGIHKISACRWVCRPTRPVVQPGVHNASSPLGHLAMSGNRFHCQDWVLVLLLFGRQRSGMWVNILQCPGQALRAPPPRRIISSKMSIVRLLRNLALNSDLTRSLFVFQCKNGHRFLMDLLYLSSHYSTTGQYVKLNVEEFNKEVKVERQTSNVLVKWFFGQSQKLATGQVVDLLMGFGEID